MNSEKGTKEKRWPDGRLEVWYANGNRKEISPDSKVVKVFYYNGDMKVSDCFKYHRYSTYLFKSHPLSRNNFLST